MSMQLSEMGALEEWAEIRIGQNTISGKTFLKFSWRKRPFFPHVAAFHLPSRFWKGKTFLETQLGIHAAASKQNHYESEPFRNFSCPKI